MRPPMGYLTWWCFLPIEKLEVTYLKVKTLYFGWTEGSNKRENHINRLSLTSKMNVVNHNNMINVIFKNKDDTYSGMIKY